MKPKKTDPRVKDILLLLGIGTFIAASILMPGLPIVLKPFIDEKRKWGERELEKFNTWRLRQVLKRLYEQKVVEIFEGGIKVTEKGKKRILNYTLEEMQLRKKTDGRWRLIIYDISNLRKPEREQFREMLKRLQFLKLQESVYLTPFVCEDEIEYLKQIFDIDKEVQILKICEIEHNEVYKKYFGL